MSASTTLKDGVLGAILNATAYSEADLYLSLHTADPGSTGANEATGGSYARQAIPKVAPSSGTYTSDAAITFASMPAGTFTHVGLWDAATAGNYIDGDALTASKTVDAGDTIQFASGALTATLS